jgi:ATP-dependent DNA ligase
VIVVLTPPVEPMLARAVPALPGSAALPGGVAFEPKYDGYRLLAFRTGAEVRLQSRNARDLTGAFPEITEAVAALGEDVVVDGEAVIYVGGRLEFTALQHRLNRPPRTAARLAREQPAHLVTFDLLQRGTTELLRLPYRERRAALEELFERHDLRAPWSLSPSTTDREQAEEWLRTWPAVGVEGLVAKGLDQPYQPGRRGWYKIRAKDTTEAVIGAVTGSPHRPETVLLGRYDDTGTLRLVARSTPLAPPLRRDLGGFLTPAGADHPWTGIRVSTSWGSREPLEFTCVQPDQVAEFHADPAIDRGRWRHLVQVKRLRADVAPGDVPPFGAGAESAVG